MKQLFFWNLAVFFTVVGASQLWRAGVVAHAPGIPDGIGVGERKAPQLQPTSFPSSQSEISSGPRAFREAARELESDRDGSWLTRIGEIFSSGALDLGPGRSGIGTSDEGTSEEKERARAGREAYLKHSVQKRGDEYSHFSYAEFLFDADRFEEAKVHALECAKFPDCKKKADVMLEGIGRVGAAGAVETVTDIKRETSEKLSEQYRKDREIKSRESGDEGATDPVASNAEAPNSPDPDVYRPSQPEYSRLWDAQSYEVDGSVKEAESAFLELVNDYPASPLSRVEYVRFLIRRGRIAEAKTQIGASEERYPNFKREPDWLILTQSVQDPTVKTIRELDASISDLLRKRRHSDPFWGLHVEYIYPIDDEAAGKMAAE